MHSKALDLLQEYASPLLRLHSNFSLPCRLSALEDDMEDRLSPSIQYLQKLGPEYIDEVFRYARWILDTDKDMAFQVCARYPTIHEFCLTTVLRSSPRTTWSCPRRPSLTTWKVSAPVSAHDILSSSSQSGRRSQHRFMTGWRTCI